MSDWNVNLTAPNDGVSEYDVLTTRTTESITDRVMNCYLKTW